MKRGRIAGAVALCVFSLVLGLGPGLRGTFALLTARTGNANSVFAATALYAPGSLQASPSGRSGALSWTAGQHGSGYKVLGFGNGTNSTCPASTSASYTAIGTATTLSYTDANRSPASVPQGTWYCYQVQTTYQSWSSVENNPVVGVRVGVVATAFNYVNTNTTRLDTGDQLIFTFNQAITPSTGPTTGNSVCNTTTTIWLASTTTSGGCATTEAVNLGRITGGSLSDNARFAATYAWSNGNTRLTVTIGSRTAGNRSPTMNGSWIFTPTTTSTKLLSTTGSFHICDTNTGGGSCTPALTVGAPGAATSQQSAGQSIPVDTDSVPATHTATATSTKTNTATLTPSPTQTLSPASTSTVANSPTAPATLSPTATSTHTAASTTTSTSTSTVTHTSTETATVTNTSTSTATAVAIATKTATATATHTATSTETTAPSATTEATATSQPTETPTRPCAGSPTATPTGIAGTSQATPTPGPCMPTTTATVAAPSPESTATPTKMVETATPSATPTEVPPTLTPSATPTIPVSTSTPTG